MNAKTVTEVSGLTVVTGSAAEDLLRMATRAHLPGDFERLYSALEDAVGQLEWKDFGGGGRVAHSAIGAATDPIHLVTELVVNESDALLELAFVLASLSGDTFEPVSPWDAACHYFGVPSGGLAEWDTRKNPGREIFNNLAARAQLLVQQGSTRARPTLTALDWGIGQHPADFGSTLLSLHLGNKAEKPYLAGQYGHGAGLTLSFSGGGQILVSRRHPECLVPGQDDLAGLVLVRRFMPSETDFVNPTYRYAVPESSGLPVAFDPSALPDPRWHGLRRTCIDYELGAPAQRVGDQARGGLYFYLNHHLPNPALPFALRDERAEKPQWRYISGNASRLTARSRGWAPRAGKNPIAVPYMKSTTIDLGKFVGDGIDYGTAVVIRYFVNQEGTGEGNSLYSPAKEAETWSLNGQVHNQRGRQHFFQTPLKFDAIRDNLVVEVRCDGLSPDAKALIFTTDRQGAAERDLTRSLEEAIDDTLASDEKLVELNEAAKDAALRRAASARDRELDRELARFQHFVEQEIDVSIAGPGKKRRGRKRSKPEIKPLKPISPLLNHPTFLRFRKTFRETIKVRQGSTGSVLLEADAVDGYFPDHTLAISTVPDLGSALRVYGADRLTDGRMRIRLKADAKAVPGHARLSASYLPPTANEPLTTSIDLEIIPPTSGTGTQGKTEKKKQRVPPSYRVLYEDKDPTWASEGMSWTRRTVGSYKNDVAYINGDYDPLRQLLNVVKSSLQEATVRLYMPPVIMTLVAFAKRDTDPPRDETGSAVELHDDDRQVALRSVALGSLFTIRRIRKLDIGGSAREDE